MNSDRTAEAPADLGGVESNYAWARLVASLAISTTGAVGLWSVVVVLPAVQAEFAVGRGSASLPYTVTMIGMVLGGIMMGRLADRFGIVIPVVMGAVSLAVGYLAAAFSESLWQFAAVHGVFIGFFGSSAMFAPMMADISHWFLRRRGLAVAVTASGSYLAGTLWPPVVAHLVESVGWRQAHVTIAIVCLVVILPLSLVLRRRAPVLDDAAQEAAASAATNRLRGLKPASLQGVLMLAGLACCAAMAMPQVHIVAYCGDLGYGSTRGAEMLSMMLGFGIVSRLASGWVADHIGPLQTLLLGSAMQALTLFLFLPFDGLASLYVISALFGLFQGGIVPSYALVVRQYFPPAEAGIRVSLVISATIAGMALGGWMSGAIFDLTLSYQAAFLNGILWNVGHFGLAVWLLWRLQARLLAASPA
ncbi:MAG: MFS transporter [Proteobacteria bacterium]|nr:MFS transporter [Pseudomonadota bacterium]